jgi:hypothetical protein
MMAEQNNRAYSTFSDVFSKLKKGISGLREVEGGGIAGGHVEVVEVCMSRLRV